eukprot:SAG11_NODE_7988_length_1072_cov_5.121274_1_plen_51_part_00
MYRDRYGGMKRRAAVDLALVYTDAGGQKAKYKQKCKCAGVLKWAGKGKCE